MANIELLGRRQLLVKGAKGALAVAILGPTVVACSSNGDDAAVLVPTPSPGDSPPDPTATTAPGAEEAAEDSPTEPETALRWERVSFDFVSAYVLARGDQVAVVDTGTRGNAERIETAIAGLGAGWGDLDHVIITHLHGDHIGGLQEVLDAAPAAVPYAGELDVSGISSSRPITPVNGGDEIFGLEIIDTPGHTAGHISVLDETAGLLVAGDALNTDDGQVLGANPDFSDDMALADDSVKVLAQRRFDALAVGHGDPIVGDASALVQALAATL